MTEAQQQQLDSTISALPFADLVAVQQRIAHLVDEKRNEAIARLEAEAAVIGIGLTIHDGNGAKHKRRRRHHEA